MDNLRRRHLAPPPELRRKTADLKEAQRRAEAAQRLLASDGWKEIVEPWMDVWVNSKLTDAFAGKGDRYVDGGAAAIAGLLAHLELVIEAPEKQLRRENKPDRFQRTPA